MPITISQEDKISLLDSELPIINKKEHEQIVDIFVVIDNTIYVDIEMNRSKFENVFEWNTKYKNRISNVIFEKGESLKELKTKYLYQLNLNASPNEEILEDTIVMYGLNTNKGKAEGKAEGIKEKTIEIAKNLLKENIDVETISKTTGLTKEDIQKLIEKGSV